MCHVCSLCLTCQVLYEENSLVLPGILNVTAYKSAATGRYWPTSVKTSYWAVAHNGQAFVRSLNVTVVGLHYRRTNDNTRMSWVQLRTQLRFKFQALRKWNHFVYVQLLTVKYCDFCETLYQPSFCTWHWWSYEGEYVVVPCSWRTTPSAFYTLPPLLRTDM